MEAVPDLTPAIQESKQKHAHKAAWGAMFAGAALSVYGWTRKSASGAALGVAGGAIALKAASAGPIADLVGTETSLSHSVIMMATAAEIYSFCKNAGKARLWIGRLRDLPSAAGQDRGKENSNPILGSSGSELRILEDVPHQRLRWQILDPRPQCEDCIAELTFTNLPAVRGTLVTLAIRYKLHIGMLHSGAPQIIEAGEIATIRGQSHGTRTLKGKLIGTLLGEEVA